MYLVNDFTQTVLVRNYKVASTSLLASLGYNSYAVTKEMAQHYLSYKWIIVARHPFGRLESFWNMQHYTLYMKFSDMVDGILSGNFRNVHTLPQTDTLLKPADYIYHFETLSEDFEEIKKHFQAPDDLPHLRKAVTDESDLINTLAVEQIEGLREYYKKDFETFGYD